MWHMFWNSTENLGAKTSKEAYRALTVHGKHSVLKRSSEKFGFLGKCWHPQSSQRRNPAAETTLHFDCHSDSEHNEAAHECGEEDEFRHASDSHTHCHCSHRGEGYARHLHPYHGHKCP